MIFILCGIIVIVEKIGFSFNEDNINIISEDDNLSNIDILSN